MTDLFDETCGACFYYREPKEKEPSGTCWRYPPTPLSIPVQQPQTEIAVPKGNTQGAGITGVMTFPVRPPVTGDTLACGEWLSKDAPLDGDEPSAA